MRIAVKFSRMGRMRFVSHLDMQRLFSRALRRAGIDVAYKGAFNPHMVLSFATALPVGMETTGDYLEFKTNGDIAPTAVLAALSSALPEDVRVLACGVLPEGEKKLMAALHAAAYTVTPDASQVDVFAAAFLEFLLRETMETEKKTADGRVKKLDVRPLLYACELMETGCRLTLALSSEASLSPAILLQALSEIAGEPLHASVRREELYAQRAGDRVPLMNLMEHAETALV